MKKVLGMGNALVDVLTILESDDFLTRHKLPKGSMQLVSKDISDNIIFGMNQMKKVLASGGSAANTIHGLANLGATTGYIGKVGKDEFGKFFGTDLVDNNIEPNLLLSDTETGKAIALVTPDSERTFATSLGAAVELSADDIKDYFFDEFDIFHVEGYLVYNNDLLDKALSLAKEKGLTISLDLASYNVVEDNLDFLKRIVKQYVDIVFANEEEAKAFTGKEPAEALDEIAAMCEIAVVKVGKDGSMIKKGNEKVQVGIIKANAIDTTGAGDLYAAGFLYGLIHDMSLERCGEIGAILSGKVVEVLGAKMNDETWDEIQELVGSRQ